MDDRKKILVSVHGNAYGQRGEWTKPSGIETFHYTLSDIGFSIANVFQSRLVQMLDWRNRGVKDAKFYILKYTNMPAILTENGFYTNMKQCGEMMDEEVHDTIAEAHFRAILDIETHNLFVDGD